jgi:NAD(P)H dehydrogenase (quinone)
LRRSDLFIFSAKIINLIVGLFIFLFQTAAAQMKAFWDSTGQLWQQGALVGKPVTAFTSTGTLGGGQETTIMTSVTFFTHHGMVCAQIFLLLPIILCFFLFCVRCAQRKISKLFFFSSRFQIFVPPGYAHGAAMFDISAVHGGGPWGAGTFAGDGSRQPSEAELGFAKFQGTHFAKFVKKLAA